MSKRRVQLHRERSVAAWCFAPLLLCAASCLSTEGYYRYRDAGGADQGTAGNAGTTGTAGTTGAGGKGGTSPTGTAGTTGAAGRGGTTGTAGTTGSAGRGGTTGTAGTTGSAGTTGTGAVSGTVLFMDNFENGSAQWTMGGDAAGTYSVVSDGSNVFDLAVTGGSSSKQLLAAAGKTTWTDQVLEARIKIKSFSGSSSSYLAGLAGRMTDANNYYCVALRSDGKLSIRNSGNAIGNAVSSNIVTGTWYTVKLTIISSTLTAYLNGTMVAQVSDTALASGGVGLVVSSADAEFDDVVVTAP